MSGFCVNVPAPQIVSSGSLLSQTSASQTVDVYTPSSDGEYRVDVYCTVGDSSGLSINLAWTDEVRSNSTNWIGANGSAISRYPQNVIHAVSGQPIQLQVYFTQGASDTYDIYYTVIQE